MYFEVDSQTFNSLVRANPCKDLQTMVRIHRQVNNSGENYESNNKVKKTNRKFEDKKKKKEVINQLYDFYNVGAEEEDKID